MHQFDATALGLHQFSNGYAKQNITNKINQLNDQADEPQNRHGSSRYA